MASLKPKLFCGVAFIRTGCSLIHVHAWEQLTLRRVLSQAFTPQYLSNDCAKISSGNASSTDRTNQTLHLFTSDCESRNRKL